MTGAATPGCQAPRRSSCPEEHGVELQEPPRCPITESRVERPDLESGIANRRQQLQEICLAEVEGCHGALDLQAHQRRQYLPRALQHLGLETLCIDLEERVPQGHRGLQRIERDDRYLLAPDVAG